MNGIRIWQAPTSVECSNQTVFLCRHLKNAYNLYTDSSVATLIAGMCIQRPGSQYMNTTKYVKRNIEARLRSIVAMKMQ